MGKKSTPAASTAAVVVKDNKKSKKQLAEEQAEKQQQAKDQSNLVTQLKAAKDRVAQGRAMPGDDARVELLSKYTALNRFDAEKKTLLDLWKKDKNLGWWVGYDERKGHTVTQEMRSLDGWGSRFGVPKKNKRFEKKKSLRFRLFVLFQYRLL